MAPFGFIFTPPPSPFETKLPSGTTVNWSDPLSANLVWCWAVNEGSGSCLVEVADASHRRNSRWGLDTAVGTGADAPFWTTYQKAVGLRLFGSNFNSQRIVPTNSLASGSPQPAPPHSFRKGITFEFWGKFLGGTATPTDYALVQIGTFQAGNIFEVRIESGLGRTDLRARYYGQNIMTYPDNPHFVTPDLLPNHIIITSIPGGETRCYLEGHLAFSDNAVSGIPFVGDELNVVVNLCWSENFQQGRFDGVFYKASIYDVALGPAACQALAENPMRVLGVANYPGIPAILGGVPPVLPTVTLVANPSSIVQGDTSTLTWTSTNATTLTLDQSIGSVVIPNGSTDVTPAVTTTYTITATNVNGLAQAIATVTVTMEPPLPPNVSPGAILQRDLTVFSDRALGPGDNGNPYAAFATIGSIVLTQPSEIAMILFLTTEASAVGSHPSVAVLLDEVAETIAVPFADLGPHVPDTPLLVAAQTIYNDRFYISQTRQPAVCRHLQTKISWPVEAQPNELLTWTIVGAHAAER